MTTIEQIRAEIENINVDYYKSVNGIDMTECAEDIKRNVLDIIDKDAEQEPTIPCDLCGFYTDEVCEYLSVCPAIGKAVSK